MNGQVTETNNDLLAASLGHGDIMERPVPMLARQERHAVLFQRHKRAGQAGIKQLTPPVSHAAQDAPWVRMYKQLKDAA